ncbi:MAG: hypothetical protein QM817_04890 [Archangium sp.]
MISLTLALVALGGLPPGEDLAIPQNALTGMASPRLALPIVIAFDPALTDDVTPLVKDDGTTRAGGTRDPIWALARFGPNVARRHFENASWNEALPRSIVIKSVSVMFRSGPSYEVTVEVDRYEGTKRLGQGTGKGYGTGQRNTAQRTGAAYANMFGGKPKNGLTEANPAADADVIRNATLQAFDSALLQLGMVWGGEQMMQKAKEDAEAAMKKSQPAKK